MSKQTNGSSATNGSDVNGVKPSSDVPSRKMLGGIGTHVFNPLIKGIVLFFGDGDASNQIIRDYLASQGFVVLGFDYFDRDGTDGKKPPKDSRPDFEAWAKEHQDHFKEKLDPWWKAVQENYSPGDMDIPLPYFVVGCGFGAHFAMELCVSSESKSKVVAGAFVHADFLEASTVAKVDIPVLFTFSNTGNPLDRETRPWVECILGGPKGIPTTKYCIQMFASNLPEITIGQNPKVENENYLMHESARSMSQWFIRGASLKEGPQ
ncbi:hypothetical protein SCHPADRAFT_1002429 [Schizopora paradoxa]|uniref:Uncharacterized protein n=1 Tax=Schizopora paradoxa TaxID=27342 RepID=A0A0H2R3A1_9AGAM|nr:hypothetical protein SCHPADRAFT_1002429 [Schizopora paradoxa]